MSGKGEWVNLRFPNAFAHPFSFQGRDGGTRERMLVTIPKGVVLGDGRDVGGWNLSVRATPWALAQKRAGRPVSIGLRVGRSVELFKGRGPRRVTLRPGRASERDVRPGGRPGRPGPRMQRQPG